MRWLLTCGVPANAPNFAGSTPLHSAANNKRAAIAPILILEGGADVLQMDDLNDCARESAVTSYGNGSVLLQVRSLTLCHVCGGQSLAAILFVMCIGWVHWLKGMTGTPLRQAQSGPGPGTGRVSGLVDPVLISL